MIVTTFIHVCPCTKPVPVVDGVKVPHEHAEVTVQMVRDAWASGYEFARTED